MKTVMKIALGIVLACVLLIGGCMALLGGVANEVDKEMKKEAEHDKPRPVAVGMAFSHDDFAVEAGWKVVAEEFGGTTITGLKAKNDGDEARHAQLTFTFLRGEENVGEVECSSNEMQPGQSSRLDCFSFAETIEQYDEVRVADMW